MGLQSTFTEDMRGNQPEIRNQCKSVAHFLSAIAEACAQCCLVVVRIILLRIVQKLRIIVTKLRIIATVLLIMIDNGNHTIHNSMHQLPRLLTLQLKVLRLPLAQVILKHDGEGLNYATKDDTTFWLKFPHLWAFYTRFAYLTS